GAVAVPEPVRACDRAGSRRRAVGRGRARQRADTDPARLHRCSRGVPDGARRLPGRAGAHRCTCSGGSFRMNARAAAISLSTNGAAWFTSGRALAPGLLASGVLAAAAAFLSQHYGTPVMLMALLLGMAMNFLCSE